MTHNTHPRKRSPRQHHTRNGFTLIETAMSMIIIGVGVLAMVDAQRAFVQSNLWSSHAASGAFLAEEIREFARNLPRHDPVVGLDPDNNYAFGMETGETTVDDIDDLDDLDGLRFGYNGNVEGPINALGELIPEIDLQGNVMFDQNGDEEAMAGWAQEVTVEKIEPFDTSITRGDAYFRDSDTGGLPPLAVDAFPLRVTVVVTFTTNLGEEIEMARLSWIAP